MTNLQHTADMRPAPLDAHRSAPQAQVPFPRMVQIEITTRCNYDCFYCAGRVMPQRDMDRDLALGIISRLPRGAGGVVSLQGEGEPSAHPGFWDFVEAVLARGWVPHSILNGTRIAAQRIAQAFPRIGVSIDTIDPALADRIGRYNVAKVIRNVESLVREMGGERVTIHMTDFGQDLQALSAFVRRLGARQIIQPLQAKDDYLIHYASRLPGGFHLQRSGEHMPKRYSCLYLEQPLMRYYTLDGTEMPCCYIKDATAFESVADLRATLSARDVPRACKGCRFLA